jgi:hypothetical protein
MFDVNGCSHYRVMSPLETLPPGDRKWMIDNKIVVQIYIFGYLVQKCVMLL